ncbi:MAG TPA: alkaline phosphatase family protein [Ktedonobacterales bacterium]
MRALLRSPSATVTACLVLVASLLVAACVPGHSEDAGRTAPPGPAPTATSPGVPFTHVFVIVMENEEATAIYGSASAPYINQLAAQYAVAAQYYAVTHPSLPNYISLVAGSPNPLDGTDCSVGPTCHVPGARTNVADEIEASGRTWVAYMDAMPAPCAQANAGTYAVRHNPFVYFDDIRNGPNDRCATHDLPFDAAQFAAQLENDTAPDFVWITPDLCHDGHDLCGTSPVAQSDAWLARTVPPILASNAFQRNGVLFIVWDEGTSDRSCCGLGEGGGNVAALVISPLAKPGYRSTMPYSHYSLLRTIEDAWHLGELGNTNPAVQPGVQPMTDIFTVP